MRPTIALITAVLIVCGLGGCSRDPTSAPPPSPPPVTFEELRGEELGVIDYAARTLRDHCMADAGYPQNLQALPDAPSNLLEPVVAAAHGLEPEDEAEAHRRGLGWDVRAQPPRVVSFDAGYDAAMQRCSMDAWSALGADAGKTYAAYLDVVNQITGAFGPEVDAASDPSIPTRMYDCMAAHGYRAADRKAFLRRPDPTTAFGVPLGTAGEPDRWQPNRTPGTVQVSPPVRSRHYRPTPPESTMAVQWLRCSVSTGRQADFRRASLLVQAALIRRHADALVDLAPPITALAGRARALTAELPGR
jgi:hypothetical protein